MGTHRRRILGTRAEQIVADRYRQAGYRLLVANWRCSLGEVDLVLEGPEGDVVVFCEVKARTSTRFGTPFDAVTPAKQRRLRRLAGRWLAERHGDRPGQALGRPHRSMREVRRREVRFDVAGVAPRRDGSWEVEVLEGAF